MARSGTRSSVDVDRGELAEPQELSLEEVLKSYEQPINEEQAWALCYQVCSGLRAAGPPQSADPRPAALRRLKGPASIRFHRDGTVSLQLEPHSDDTSGLEVSHPAESQLVQSLGVAIYRALDWGLDDSEERELSPQLEHLIERMTADDQGLEDRSSAGGCMNDEGYSGQEDEEEEVEQGGDTRPVSTIRQVMALCASRLANPSLAPEHYQAVCRAQFLETLELQTFLIKIRDAKEMLKKMTTDEVLEGGATAELDALKHRDWARLWVQLMKELRQGVKLKKVQEQPFNPLPTEFSLTPFEMLMEDIRARRFQLRKVTVDSDIPNSVKRNAHELILDFIRSRPPLKPVSERCLPPPPPRKQSLHDQVLAEIKQQRRLRPVGPPCSRSFGSLPCLAHSCSCSVKSTSCIDLSTSEAGPRPPSRPRVLLKAPTLAEMEEMNISEEEESPGSGDLMRNETSPTPMKRDRSFSEHDLALLRGEMLPSLSDSIGLGQARDERPHSRTGTGAGYPPNHRASFPPPGWAMPSSVLHSVQGSTEGSESMQRCQAGEEHQWMEEFSHPVESLALTVDEVINVRRVLVRAEMEKFVQSKELYNSLKRGKVCCCCRVKFPLFSWPSTCLLCKRPVCGSCRTKIKIPCKKMAHIPVYTVGFHNTPNSQRHKSQFHKFRSLSQHAVEDEFPHLYALGCTLRDICAECTKFVAEVISSSRRSLDIINSSPRRSSKAQRPQKPCPSHPEAPTQLAPPQSCSPHPPAASSQSHDLLPS
ncbi:protein spire homolog 2 [Thalassophryne amazonica]|uniref:protein spire homolog 2 n=1 Tax=Thalassophryne amazonica TaxID=390379 RepID=UPI00147173C3|nr:protein spire homolog 2 [Thalassophryne amazonica]